MQIPWVGVDIWPVRLTVARPEVLSDSERERTRRFRFEADQQRWSRTHSALRRILAGYTGRPPLELRFAAGEHGKPYLCEPGGPHFNLSHSGDWAVIAVCEHCPVGVDIERMRENTNIAALLDRLGERDLPVSREECFQRWAQREARTKAGGGPLMEQPADTIRTTNLKIAAGYAAAVAVIGSQPVPNIRFDATSPTATAV